MNEIIHYCILQIDAINYGIIDATYRENGKKCHSTLVKKDIGQIILIVSPLAKNSPYTKTIDQQ